MKSPSEDWKCKKALAVCCCTLNKTRYVTGFLVFHSNVTVNIGLKHVIRMAASILLIRCLCYKPERIRNWSKKPQIGTQKSDLIQYWKGKGLRPHSVPVWSYLLTRYRYCDVYLFLGFRRVKFDDVMSYNSLNTLMSRRSPRAQMTSQHLYQCTVGDLNTILIRYLNGLEDVGC